MQQFQLNDEFVGDLTEAQPRIYGFIFKRLLNPHHTAEVLQETNLVLCRKATDFRPGTNFMAWAFQVAHFQILAHRKRQSREKLVFDDSLLESLHEEEPSSPEPHARRLKALEDCLTTLPAETRRIVIKRYVERSSVQGMAEDANKTPNAVSRLLHRSRLALIDCVKLKLSQSPTS